MSLKINRAAALDAIAQKVSDGLESGLNQMVAVAVKNAPVRKDKARTPRKREETVRALKENFIPDRTRYTAFQNSSGRKPVLAQAKVVSLNRMAREQLLDPRASKEDLAKRATVSRGTGSFTFKFVGARSGNEVGNIGFDPGRGRLTAKAAVRGGNLKSKIRRTEITRNGTRLSGSLISGAPYSNVVEFGFLHVGGKRVPAQPFMRPAREAYKSNWRSHFKKR